LPLGLRARTPAGRPAGRRRYRNQARQIGIGGVVAHSPLPHHRTCGSAYGGSVRLS